MVRRLLASSAVAQVVVAIIVFLLFAAVGQARSRARIPREGCCDGGTMCELNGLCFDDGFCWQGSRCVVGEDRECTWVTCPGGGG